MNRIKQIDNRLIEIRKILKSDAKDINLDDLEVEVDSLTEERGRLVIAEGINDGSIQGRHLPKPGEEGTIFTSEHRLTEGGCSYRSMFFRDGSPNENHGFKNFGDFIRTINSGRYDERLQKRQMIGGVGSLGGFSVPTEYGPFIFDSSLEQEIIRPRAAVWPMKSDTFKAPAWAGNDHSASVFGGFNGVWLGEAQAATDQEAALREIELTANKLGIFVSVSNELLDDSPMFENQLKGAMGSALSYELDRAFLMGDGVAKPLGILNSPSIIDVNRAVAGQLGYIDIIAMFARLHPALQQGAVWICNNSLLPEMLSMEDNGNHLVWHPDGAGLAPRTLLGREVIFTEKTPTLGTRGDLILVNLKQYVIGMRREIGMEKSNAPGWQQDLSSFRAIVRVDGQAAWDEPVTPSGGGNTLSWAVTLS